MGSPLCDPCMGRDSFCCKTHLARVCSECDSTLHYVTVDSPDHSRFRSCNNCVSQTAAVQCLDQGLCLCQTCVSKANVTCNVSNTNSGYSFPPHLDLDSSYLSSLSSSFSSIDLNWGSPFVPLPPDNGDSSSSGIFQNFDNHTKNSSDQKLHYLDIPKDSSCSGLDGYKTKDIENVWLNNFEDYKAVLDIAEELILTDQLIDEIMKHNTASKSDIISSSSSHMSSAMHKDYNIEALANATCEDYKKNQIICSKAKQETNNNVGTFPQARIEAMKRYFAKKKKRKFGKQIRYESRKSTADTKRRLKGRFTKAGAEYDYDPGENNTNKETNKIMT